MEHRALNGPWMGPVEPYGPLVRGRSGPSAHAGCAKSLWGQEGPSGRSVRVGSIGHTGGMFARRAPGALLLDYVPPEEPPSTPLGNALRIR